MVYFLETEKCCIPYTLKIENDQPIIVYLDDIIDLYKSLEVSINELLNVKNKIILAFKCKNKPSRKNKKRTLITYNGNKIINEEEYNLLIKKISPFYYEDFFTMKIKNEKEELEYFIPNDFYEAVDFVKNHKIISTAFINKLTNEGKLIYKNNILEINDSFIDSNLEFKCDCCNIDIKYLIHLLKLNEINAFILIQKHNLNEWEKIYDSYK